MVGFFIDRNSIAIFNYMKNKNVNIELSFKRRDMVSQGAYDGRFRNRMVMDKKKHSSKMGARKWKIDRD
jgi:hypothetical protein